MAPGLNQLVNPCFEGKHGAAPISWQQTGGWDVSWKPSNPCSPSHMAARINDAAQSGLSGPDRDERIWQVVHGQGADLVAEMQCVHHYAYFTDMNIYGGETVEGPWTLVWTPFTLADCSQDDRWDGVLRHDETVLTQPWPFYKVEFAAMYPPIGPGGDEGGVKFTSAFFASGK